MEKQFVPYEIAMKLKEKGFEEECFGFFSCGNIGNCTLVKVKSDIQKIYYKRDCLAPTHQQIVDWFDEKHNITIDSYAEYDNYGCEVCIRSKFGWLDGIDMDLKGFKTRNEAVNEGILTALDMVDNSTKKII